MNKCLTCNKSTKNPKFCSRNCAAITNNKLVPKRKPEGKCVVCNCVILKQNKYCGTCWKNRYKLGREEKFCKKCNVPIDYNKKYCNQCWNDTEIRNYIKNNETDIDDYPSVKSLLKHRDIIRYHRRVRDNARKIYFKNFSSPICEKCGYKHHIEVCHVIPLKEFVKQFIDYKIVNCLTNLVGLCPNCHWEFDHGLFPITDIQRFIVGRIGFAPMTKKL